MPYNFAADSFHTKNFVADFLQAKSDFLRKSAVLRFSDGLRGNVRRSCYAHWKARNGLPISIN